MAKREHVKERIEGVPPAEYFDVRQQAGWKLIAVEWERDSGDATTAKPQEEVPYGMRVAGDCQHLEYEPNEMATLMLLMELIIQEHGFPRIATELNQQGLKQRGGQEWTAVAAWNLLPRLIEVGPRMFSLDEWVVRRKRIASLMGNR